MTELLKESRRELQEYKQKHLSMGHQWPDNYGIMEEDTDKIEQYAIRAIRTYSRMSRRYRRSNGNFPEDERRNQSVGPSRGPSPRPPDTRGITLPTVLEIASESRERERPETVATSTALVPVRPTQPNSNRSRPRSSTLESGVPLSGHPSKHTIRRVTRAMRIRDNGSEVTEGIGIWPQEINGSNEGLADDAGDANRDLREERSVGSSPAAPTDEDNRHGESSRSKSRPSSGHKSVSGTGDRNSNEESPGPYQAMPPFGGKGGRRRPRRPRRPSPSNPQP